MNEKCTGCKKGLVFVAKVIMYGTEKDRKALMLCSKCRELLTITIKGN